MQIHIKELASKAKPVQWTESLDLTPLLKERSDLIEFGPVHADLQAGYNAGAVEVDGTLKASITQPCSRCLTPVKHELNIPLHEVFIQRLTEGSDEDEEDNVHHITEDSIDLMPYVEENVLLAIPFVPLCDEDCKGLCPVCGVNRNEQPCDCSQEKIDPRLAGLADFF